MTTLSNRFIRMRSPLLRAIGDWSDSETPGILRRRRAAIAGMALLAAGLVVVTRAGLWPGPALAVFYVLHDYVALPFWGYTWTFLAPYSITWWSLAGIAFVIWLATFLTRRSAVRRFHARLCRLLVVHFVAHSSRSSRFVARLTAWVDWLAARTLGAELLKDVVRFEQTDALRAVVNAPAALDERTAWRLLRLTDFLARLTSDACAPAHERWRALAIWHQTLMWIDRRAGSDPRSHAAGALFAALAATGRSLLERLDSVDDVEGDPFSSGLRRDLRWLIEYASSLALRASAGPAFGRTDRPFMSSVLDRLDELWSLAESGRNDDGASIVAAKTPDRVIEVQGLLISSIGLHAASRADDVHLADAYLQAFEALGFVSYLGAAGREGSRVARALTADAPERDHYRLVADIAERHRMSAFELRASARLTPAQAVGRAVLDEADSYQRIRIDGLHDAAGQDFAHSASKRSQTPARSTPAERESRPSAQREGGDRDVRSRLRWRIRHRPLPLRARVDPVLLGGLGAAAGAYCVATAALVLLLGPSFTAGWSARSLADRRLLENVRRGLGTALFLDAIFHAPDRQLVLSQRGGVFHSYDPDTGLWSTERPFGPDDLERPDVRLLASSSDERSGVLWGVTVDGGLVRRLNGRWEVIVGDTKFLGRKGTPIQQGELSAIAASSDGKWLLAAAGADGVGIQDLERRRWLSRDEIPPGDSPSTVTQAVWWRDRFYVGGPEGVSELAGPSTRLGAGRHFAFRRVKGLEGTVVALEATPEDGLFVHQTVPCENGPSGCVRLSRITQPSAAPAVLIDERNRYTELSLERMMYAVQWQDHLLLAGSGGIFDYDVRLRAWKRQGAETISAIGPCASSPCFYFGYGGRSSGVGLFTSKTITGEAPSRWALPGEQPTRIAVESPGRAAVLTAAGRAYALGSNSVATLINPATSSSVPLHRYHAAVTFGDKVLYFGAPGAMLHDIVRRSYSPLRAVPEWLRSPASIVAASGAFLFGLERRGASYDARVVPQQQVELGTLVFNTSKPFPVDGPIRAVDASSPDVLRVIDGRGRVQSITSSGVTPLTGGRSGALTDMQLLDVAGTGDILGAATVGGVRLYSMRTRSWSDPLPAPAGERAVDLAERQGTWIARSATNRLLLVGDRPSTVIGGGEQMPARAPNDVLQKGAEIYLSWPGTIQRYDPRLRQVAASWMFDGAGPPRLAGVFDAQPLSVAGGIARIGERAIARGVQGMFTSGSNLWLTRMERGQRYLEVRPLASLADRPAAQDFTPSCVFRTPTVGVDAHRLHDARRLSNGLVAVTTDAGLRLHSRERHSWYGVAGLLPATGRGALATIGSTLIVQDGNGNDTRATLQIVRSTVKLPDTCSAAPARLDAAPEVVVARAVALDERGARAYIVKDDGSVDRVEQAATAPVMARESQGPPETDVVRAWHFPDTAPSTLWIATRRSLWQYDLERLTWSEITLAYPVTARTTKDVSIDLYSESGEIAVFVTAVSGVFRGRVAREPGRQSKIALAPSSAVRRGDGAQSPVFRIGAVTFFRNVSRGVLATLQTNDGRSVVAYQNRAFAWDRGRRGIAIGREGPLLLTDAGIHAAGRPSRFASFDSGPPGAPSPADRLISGPDLVPRMLRGNRWYRRVAEGVWQPASLPSNDAILADDGGLVWSRRNGSIVVESKTGVRVPFVTGANGAGLSTDRLIDAARYGTGVAMLTRGFVEIEGALFSAPQGDTLESATIDSREMMWLTQGDAASIWNVERRAFEPAPSSANPLRLRTLAESGPLRLTRAGPSTALRTGAIEGAVRVVDLQGQLSWMPIDLSSGRFPFDVVRSIAFVGNVLYVGTDAGLQTYDGTDFALERVRLTTVGAGISSASPTVARVGESCDVPGTAVACGPRGCATQAASAFVATSADALSCRLRARSPFWSWQVDASGLSGRYDVTPVPGTRATAPALSAVEGPVTLADGQLPHDAIGQITSFGGSTFTVWQSRYVGVHYTGLALAGARNHAFALPVRLLSITAAVPMLLSRDRDLTPGLYAIEGPRTWRYRDSEWVIVTDAAEMATIAEYGASPPLLQRKRLRLVHRAPASAPLAIRRGRPHEAPVFEMRMPGGAWTPLAWDASANRYALDVWQDIAVHRKTLWTATPAGLVSRDGDWSFDPDTFRVVERPSQEAGRIATDLRVSDGAADLRYDGARAYRIAIDGAPAEPPLRLERDPFAEQTFDTDATSWTWRIAGRTGSSAGRLAGAWKGEPIAVVNGRFDFDAVNSIAVFQRLLHIATNTRGWFALPLDSAALERVARPTRTSVPPLEVARLYGNRDPDEPELCLQGLDGQFARLSPNGASRRTQGCPILAARTGFWRYVRDGSALRVLPAAGAARSGERRLVDGRFSDEVITGPPVTGTKDRRSFTLVPTSAAVMWWDAAGQVVDMHAPPFQGKPDVPRLLQWMAGGSPAYVADGTLYSLENDDKPRDSWTVRLPPKAVFERLRSGPGPLLSIDWSQDGRRHHSVVDPRNSSVSHDEIPIDARRIPAYFRRAMTVPSHDGLIRLRLRDHVVSAYATSEGWPIVEADDSFQLLAGVSRGTRAILVGPQHLIELNMERIARAVYSGASPPPPPGSDKKK